MSSKDTLSWGQGIDGLKSPVWPLLHVSILLFLTGPFKRLDELLDELTSSMEMEGVIYNEPRKKVSNFIEILRPLELLKRGEKIASYIPPISSHEATPIEPLEALTAWIKQCVLERELEDINSLLCAPCNCVICCTGPEPGSKKELFEIPLDENELLLFDLPRHETLPDTLLEEDFVHSSPGIYHFAKGWRMILPRGSKCPQLSRDGRCAIYENRPIVCRKPQIFPYVIQKNERDDAFIKEEKLLAVWDCPYVRKLKEEIIQYGQKCGLETIFMENKV